MQTCAYRRLKREIQTKLLFCERKAMSIKLEVSFHKNRCASFSNAISMTNQHGLAFHCIDGTMAHSFKFFFVSFKQNITATFQHIAPVTVEIRPHNLPTPPHSNAICAFHALAAIVPTHKKIIPTSMKIDERGFYCIRSGLI